MQYLKGKLGKEIIMIFLSDFNGSLDKTSELYFYKDSLLIKTKWKYNIEMLDRLNLLFFYIF